MKEKKVIIIGAGLVGSLCAIHLIKKGENKVVAKKIDLKIIFEDNDIIVLDKPKGMVVHPGAGNFENTLVNALKFKYKIIYLV